MRGIEGCAPATMCPTRGVGSTISLIGGTFEGLCSHCYAVDGKSKWKFDSGLHYTIPQAAGMLALACGAVTSPVRLSRSIARLMSL